VAQHPIVPRKSESLGRIVLVSPYPPFPPESGANQRTFFLWKALSEIAPVDVILCQEMGLRDGRLGVRLPANVNFLGRFFWQSKDEMAVELVKKVSSNRTVHRWCRAMVPKHLDYGVDERLKVHVTHALAPRTYFLAVGRYLKPIIKTGLIGKLPCMLDADDIDFEIADQMARDPARSLPRRVYYTVQSLERKAALQRWMPRFEGMWVTKLEDTKHRLTRNAAVLPNIPYHPVDLAEPMTKSTSTNPVLLTVGVLYYKPNCDGIDRFIRESWPKIRSRFPTAEYWLAGKTHPTMARRWRRVPGVKVLGFVDDLAAVYQTCWLTVCPLWIGAGTNIKVLESLSFGRVCVTTEVGWRGYEHCLRGDQALMIARTDSELAERCITLLEDEAQRDALVARSRAAVGPEFSYQNFVKVVHREVERTLARIGGRESALVTK